MFEMIVVGERPLEGPKAVEIMRSEAREMPVGTLTNMASLLNRGWEPCGMTANMGQIGYLLKRELKG